MESIDAFLSISYGSGYGEGDGYGSGYGSGKGYGSGYGEGDSYGSGYGEGDSYGYGYGDGSGKGYGDGYGDGSGKGYGDGSGDGSGKGYGDGDGIKSFNGAKMHSIDGVPTAILRVRGNIAKGFTLNSDLTTSLCYIVKQDNTYAHGKTLKEAQEALMQKLFEELSEEKRIDMFLEKFNGTNKYPAKEFFDWHNKLTGSCLFGRQQFVKEHNIDIEKDMFTVNEFVELTKNSYGGEVILRTYRRMTEQHQGRRISDMSRRKSIDV